MDYIDSPWRVGTQIRRAIHAIVPGVDQERHPLLGLMDTDELAAEVVTAHNRGLDTRTFAEKEQLIKDLENTREIMLSDSKLELEDAIILAVGVRGAERSKRVYDAYGASAEMLQDMDISKVVPHAINLVRTQ